MRALKLVTGIAAAAVIVVVFANSFLTDEQTEPPGTHYTVPEEGTCEEAPAKPKVYPKGSIPPEAGEIREFFLTTEYAPVADEIVAISIQETGWYRSEFHRARHNYFSTKRRPDGVTCIKGERNCLTTHGSLQDGCAWTLKHVFRSRRYRTDREGFLEDLQLKGYAKDPTHGEKVRSIAAKLRRSR